MSEGFEVPRPPGRVRPATVTAATWLLLLVVVLYVVSAVLAFTSVGTITDVYQQAYEGTELEGSEGFAGGSIIAVGVLNLLYAAGLAVLAAFDYQGRNAARIVTWVLGGLALCCGGVGLAFSGAAGNIQTNEVEGAPSAAEVQRMVEDALPSWYSAVSLTIGIVGVLALAVALLLLALPPSNQFFRKPQEEFEPPPPGYPQVG
jgi:hypothetical protein